MHYACAICRPLGSLKVAVSHSCYGKDACAMQHFLHSLFARAQQVFTEVDWQLRQRPLFVPTLFCGKLGPGSSAQRPETGVKAWMLSMSI